MTTYTNPRTRAVIEDWPLGSNRRGPALFTVEHTAGRGERAVRTTIGAPKKLTYARKVRIVDGDDGRTYIAELTMYGFVSIMRGQPGLSGGAGAFCGGRRAMSTPRDDYEGRLAGAIRAALARIRGEWDQPDLVAFGPLLPDRLADVTAILEQVEGDL